MAALLSGIVIVFLICHSTKIVTHSYEAYQVYYRNIILRVIKKSHYA